jgi:GH15 family glucan-1,4-alpha-glucosidase
MDLYLPISDYAIIGDCRSAALVSAEGSVDWLCLPTFDGPSVFNRLLDRWRGGHFTIQPAGPFLAKRAYVPGTAVLATEFSTTTGRARLIDLAPAPGRDPHLLPFWSLMRRVEGLEGEVEFAVTLQPSFDDGKTTARAGARGPAGWFWESGYRLLNLACQIPLRGRGVRTTGRFRARAGQTRDFWLAYSEEAPAVYPPLARFDETLEDTLEYWRRWSKTLPADERLARSAITLKLLSYAPSGAIVAAPTTSLPEALGGDRNWDYRFCWLRDASWTAQSFLKLGLKDLGFAFVGWMMHATALTHPELKVFYDLYGRPGRREKTAEALEGYAGSRPVRTGNEARAQDQLDVYGEVTAALLLYHEAGGTFDKDMKRLLSGLGRYVADRGFLPDHGIWEMRGDRRHYTHSKVMAWRALENVAELGRRLSLPQDGWRDAAEVLRGQALEGGFNAELGSFSQALGSRHVDATSLLFGPLGLVPPGDPRFESTVEAVRLRLSRGDLVYRYDSPDGMPAKEGAFLACSFWLVEALAWLGRQDEAAELFERAQARANDVGLFSEEVDPQSGRLLGNFPQALSHIGHLSAALALKGDRSRRG